MLLIFHAELSMPKKRLNRPPPRGGIRGSRVLGESRPPRLGSAESAFAIKNLLYTPYNNIDRLFDVHLIPSQG